MKEVKKMRDFIIEIIIVIVIILLVMGIVLGGRTIENVIFKGNKQVIDLNIRFDKCITYLGNEKIEIDVDKWNDYEGEQIQVVDKNGNVYLLSSFNTMLVKENIDE